MAGASSMVERLADLWYCGVVAERESKKESSACHFLCGLARNLLMAKGTC
jgi:hypothetical protein